ncbi:MAG: hypothetical protein WD045_08690 [Pirellulaceae bacterium]
MIVVVAFTLLVMATLAVIGVVAGLISLGMAALPFSRPVRPVVPRHFQGPNHSESNSTSPSREGEVIEGRVVSRH